MKIRFTNKEITEEQFDRWYLTYQYIAVTILSFVFYKYELGAF